MKKTIIGDDIYFTLAWSPTYRYDKYDAMRILPELPGIICLLQIEKGRENHLLYYSCWRDGIRLGMKNIFDPFQTKMPPAIHDSDKENLYYKFTIVDSSDIQDFQDILYWLLQTYRPDYNDHKNYQDSQRFRNIYINEVMRDRREVVERIHGHR